MSFVIQILPVQSLYSQCDEHEFILRVRRRIGRNNLLFFMGMGPLNAPLISKADENVYGCG